MSRIADHRSNLDAAQDLLIEAEADLQQVTEIYQVLKAQGAERKLTFEAVGHFDQKVRALTEYVTGLRAVVFYEASAGRSQGLVRAGGVGGYPSGFQKPVKV